jgi:hypothetical protein
MIQNLVQKYLSKHDCILGTYLPNDESLITSVRINITERVEKKGKFPIIEDFDQLFKKSVWLLRKPFFQYIHRPDITKFIIEENLDLMAEFIHVSACILQSFWRKRFVMWQMARKKANVRMLKLANAQQSESNIEDYPQSNGDTSILLEDQNHVQDIPSQIKKKKKKSAGFKGEIESTLSATI